MQAVLYGPNGLPLTPQTPAIVDPTFAALRTSMRPLEYQYPGLVLGHYTALSKSGAAVSIGAAGILASARWSDSTRLMALLRLSALIQVTGAITIATPLDMQAFIFRGASATGSGGATLVGGASSQNQKNRASMGGSLLLANGEIRTLTTAALAAVAGKTNDGAAFGGAAFGTQVAPNVGATANVTAPIAALVTGWQDIYKADNPYKHPIILANNEGIEIQTITASPVTGSIMYLFQWEWAEVLQF